MKKSKLLGSVVLATGLFAAAPLATLSSCAPGGEHTDEEIVTLRSVNLSKKVTSVFTADAMTPSNDSEDKKPALWETELDDQGQLILSEVTGEDEQGETVSISPDWTKQIDENHLILSFSNNLHDEGNVQYCVNITNGQCTKLKDFWVVQTIDEHEAAFPVVGDYIYFVADYVNRSGRQHDQSGGLIKVKKDYFDTFEESDIIKVSDPYQSIGTMVWDKGRPVAHQFAVNSNGDVLYFCSSTDGKVRKNDKNNKWGLLYKKLNEDGTYSDAYRLMYYWEGGTPEYMPCDTMCIYSQGQDFYYKDGGNGIVFKPSFTGSELDEELGYCKVLFDKHRYLTESEIYDITDPYSRHIVRTKTSSGKERIVNIDNGHVFDLWYQDWEPKEGDAGGNHHVIFPSRYDYLDYSNQTAFFLNKAKVSAHPVPPQIFTMDLTADKFVVDGFNVEGDFNTDNLLIKSFKVLNDSQVIINAYDESKIAYVVIKGNKGDMGWTFSVDSVQYNTEMENVEVIERNLN